MELSELSFLKEKSLPTHTLLSARPALLKNAIKSKNAKCRTGTCKETSTSPSTGAVKAVEMTRLISARMAALMNTVWLAVTRKCCR